MVKTLEQIELLPLIGIRWDNKTIPLSASREDIKNLLGEPDIVGERQLYYYFHNELCFHFDGNGKAEFIEFLGGPDGKLQPNIYGVPTFQTAADELYQILSGKNCGEVDDNENGYSYSFLNISVGVFRPRTPESVEDMAEEAEEEGEPMEEEELADERKKANHWATIGIGIENYYG